MEASVLSRLEQLRGEHALGTRRLDELSREFDATRETVVRISGAIQVLEELLDGAVGPQAGAAADEVLAGVSVGGAVGAAGGG